MKTHTQRWFYLTLILAMVSGGAYLASCPIDPTLASGRITGKEHGQISPPLAPLSSADSSVTSSSANQEPVRAKVSEAYGRLPLRFEANQGQAPSPVNFISRGAGAIGTAIYSVSNTSWIETGSGAITWNNKPARGNAAISGTVSIGSTKYANYEFDITNYVKGEKAAGRNVVSLAIHNPSTSSNYIKVNSRESAAKPVLVIAAQ
jgi:hypothetical protein